MDEQIIRVIYTLEVVEGREGQLHEAWRAIVDAHAARGHGALGSMLLEDPEAPRRWIAISRWASRARWEAFQTEEAAPDAYAAFDEACEVIDRLVLRELEVRPDD